jgi:hypothetical protein
LQLKADSVWMYQSGKPRVTPWLVELDLTAA